jgi:[protein-PII] uridylyltransferase
MQNISESLKRQRDQILEDGSEDALGRHTSLLEIAVITLYNRMVNQLGLDSEQYRSSGAVIALGSFGRGLIGPNQPISILFLKAESSPWQESWLDEITTPLTEAGWDVTIRHATTESLMLKVREDFPLLLHLLQARYISGSRALGDQFDKTLESSMEGRQDEFLHRLYDSYLERRLSLGNPQRWLEPDLMENHGGLLDIDTIRAACRIASNIRNLDDAIFRGYLVRDEVDYLQQAEKKYVRLLNSLYTLKNHKSGVLEFDEQATIAVKFGYSATAGFLPVESFMQRLHQSLHGVSCIIEEFWERLREGRWEDAGDENVSSEEIESGVLVRSGKLVVQPDRCQATASNLLHLFVLSAKGGLGFSNTTRQWIQHHHATLDTAGGDPAVRDELLELLRSDAPDLPAIRRFYDKGFLNFLIPELSTVHCLVQHDAFHAHPVHEHQLRTLTEFKRLLAGEYRDAEPELTKIAEKVSDPTALLLSCLLHDVGKSRGSDHAVRGGEMIPTIARRLGIDQETSDLLQFLVAHHLLLTDSAAMRDLADEEMLARCAMIVETPEQLDLLVLLSFADMAATGPNARQRWRETPVLRLYEKVQCLLEKGEPSEQAIHERIDRIRALVWQSLESMMSSEDLDKHFSELAPRYLFSNSPSAIARHLRLEWTLRQGGGPFVWEVAPSEAPGDLVEMTLVSWDAPKLVSQTAGILSLHDLNIVGAQIFAKQNGVAILIFQCRQPGWAIDWESVRHDMMRLLSGKLALDYRIALQASGPGDLLKSIRPMPSRITVDNDSSVQYTILEVYTLDRIGLLYTIAKTLADLHVRILVAKITTKVDQVADVFYLRTADGQKVTDPEQAEEIKCALQFWLDCAAS